MKLYTLLVTIEESVIIIVPFFLPVSIVNVDRLQVKLDRRFWLISKDRDSIPASFRRCNFQNWRSTRPTASWSSCIWKSSCCPLRLFPTGRQKRRKFQRRNWPRAKVIRSCSKGYLALIGRPFSIGVKHNSANPRQAPITQNPKNITLLRVWYLSMIFFTLSSSRKREKKNYVVKCREIIVLTFYNFGERVDSLAKLKRWKERLWNTRNMPSNSEE